MSVAMPGAEQTQAGEKTPISTRAAPPRPRRLSRKAIVALAATAMTGIAAALAFSLGERRGPMTIPETVSVERRPVKLLDEGPRDYSDLAKRAAGDIGPPPTMTEPIPADAEAAPPVQSPADQAEQQRRQQADSARASRLFASTGERPSSKPETPVEPQTQGAQQPESSDKSSFLERGREPSVNSGRLQLPPGRHVVTAGSTIPAALITGLSSDLPGQAIAQVTEDVFDSRSGQIRLIPQGARLIGSYDEDVGYGQTRALVVWTRLILPDGRSLDLDRLIGADASGQSGLTGKVDNHWGAMLKAGVLSTLLGLGAAVTELGEDGQIANAIRDSAGQTIGRAGDRIVEKQLGVKPTVTVKPGARVRVLVSRDLVFGPWVD